MEPVAAPRSSRPRVSEIRDPRTAQSRGKCRRHELTRPRGRRRIHDVGPPARTGEKAARNGWNQPGRFLIRNRERRVDSVQRTPQVRTPSSGGYPLCRRGCCRDRSVGRVALHAPLQRLQTAVCTRSDDPHAFRNAFGQEVTERCAGPIGARIARQHRHVVSTGCKLSDDAERTQGTNRRIGREMVRHDEDTPRLNRHAPVSPLFRSSTTNDGCKKSRNSNEIRN